MTSFGHSCRSQWLLDPDVTYLNHGTVGATPIAVLEEQRKIRDEIERQPAKFLFRELFETTPPQQHIATPRLRAAANTVGEFVGADGDDIVFVDNASAGVNAVLRSFPFDAGDTLVLTSFGYGSFPGLADFVQRRHGVNIVTIDLPLPVLTHEELIEAFSAGLPQGARMVIVDHIASATGMRMPIEEMAKICRERGVLLFVDGAHAPGSIHLDISAIGADLYVGNLHKWMWTPRSSAILWARPELQPLLHPTVLSWGYNQGFRAEFDLVGTRDPSAHLTAPSAIAHLKNAGFDSVVHHNHSLVRQARDLLCAEWDVHPITPDDGLCTLVAVPLPSRLGLTPQDVPAFRNTLLDTHNIEVHVASSKGQIWVRIAAQIYNDLTDVERLASVVNGL